MPGYIFDRRGVGKQCVKSLVSLLWFATANPVEGDFEMGVRKSRFFVGFVPFFEAELVVFFEEKEINPVSAFGAAAGYYGFYLSDLGEGRNGESVLAAGFSENLFVGLVGGEEGDFHAVVDQPVLAVVLYVHSCVEEIIITFRVDDCCDGVVCVSQSIFQFLEGGTGEFFVCCDEVEIFADSVANVERECCSSNEREMGQQWIVLKLLENFCRGEGHDFFGIFHCHWMPSVMWVRQRVTVGSILLRVTASSG